MSPKFRVSDLVASVNQTFEYAYPLVEVEGEVASFKVNQGKFVFFDLKDEESSVNCFMMVFQLRVPIEEGMKVIVSASPKLTKWGKFSLTIKSIRPSGEGSIKKSFELLQKKLDQEGLFSPERKRLLPKIPHRIGVISSKQAAGYSDFIKILNDRWGGMRVDVASVNVQGSEAPDQIIRALNYFNTQEELCDVVVIVRGGGSADDLSAFNDEQLVRAIASSRIPILTGIGHEVDMSLCDMVADMRASTPSNAAQIVVPNRHDIISSTKMQVQSLIPKVMITVEKIRQYVGDNVDDSVSVVSRHIERFQQNLSNSRRLLAEFDPARALERGYALIRGTVKIGNTVEIELAEAIINAKVETYDKK